jgi:hypothetical protein
MRRSVFRRLGLLGSGLVTLVAALVLAAPAEAQDWNIPNNIRYSFYPTCDTHMDPFQSGYGTMTCRGEYIVNRSNYIFTQDNIHACPSMGVSQRITLDYVLNPADGGVTTTKVLAGFSMHW